MTRSAAHTKQEQSSSIFLSSHSLLCSPALVQATPLHTWTKVAALSLVSQCQVPLPVPTRIQGPVLHTRQTGQNNVPTETASQLTSRQGDDPGLAKEATVATSTPKVGESWRGGE